MPIKKSRWEYASLASTTIDLYRGYSFDEAYANAGMTKTGDYYAMQDFTATVCPTIALTQTDTVVDSRDGSTYNVARLTDGNCWMLDNLALDLTDSTIVTSLSNANTNASDTTLSYLKGTSTRDPSTDPDGQYATAAVSDNWNDSYSYSAPLVNISNKDVVPDGAMSGSKGSNKVGGYYNYCAASAGSYCYGNGTSYGTSSGNATEDICPAGWRMPTGGYSGEYQALANAITGGFSFELEGDDVTNFKTALSTPLSGDFNYGFASFQGSYGNFWSSTRLSDDFMFRLDVGAYGVAPQNYIRRYYGYSVRCVLQ